MLHDVPDGATFSLSSCNKIHKFEVMLFFGGGGDTIAPLHYSKRLRGSFPTLPQFQL